MRSAAFRVIPSLCYESFPRSLVEAFACGLPVIASRLGSLAELVDDGRTGILFNPGDVTDLADKLEWARANPAAMARMGDAARAEYERKYTPANNYDRLIAIYRDAIDEVRRREL
jgi:glycosyltransferase involved in cell wall biosynthesis